MAKIPVYVGLDYHEKVVQVCVMDFGGQILLNRPCNNDWRAIVDLVESRGRVVQAGIESCCGAANLAEELVAKKGWLINLAHPGYVGRMKLNPDKHDWGDARMLADLVRVGYLPRVWLAPQAIRDLRLLVRYRQQLVEAQRNAKLRIGALLREHRIRQAPAQRWTRVWRCWIQQHEGLTPHVRWVLDRQLARLDEIVKERRLTETYLEKATADDPVIQDLMKLPGVGHVTAWLLRAEVGRFDRFRNGKQLSRFCGLTPRNASSGLRQADAGLIKAGNPVLRAVLIQAAHRLMRHHAGWAQLAERLLRAGKPKSVVTAAVANRWIRWLFHQMQPERKTA